VADGETSGSVKPALPVRAAVFAEDVDLMGTSLYTFRQSMLVSEVITVGTAPGHWWTGRMR